MCVSTIETFAHVQDAREVKLRSNLATKLERRPIAKLAETHIKGRYIRGVVDDK